MQMRPDEFVLIHHRNIFRLACYEKKGMEFQSFFEKIMIKHDPTFISVKPSGREGDWKADGFSQKSGIVFQAYAPEDMTNAKSTKKILDDFLGAKAKWGNKMKKWVFVWSSSESLPARAINKLQDLKEKYGEEVIIDDLSREGLWKIVSSLSLSDRNEILGFVPSVSPSESSTAAEIQVLLNYLVRQPAPTLPDNIDLTDLAEKIAKNKLSTNVRGQIQKAMTTVRVVDRYVKNHSDIEYSQLVANVLAYQYTKYARFISEPDEIFSALVEYVRGNASSHLNYWPAVGIIAYYFQLCDIFEK